MIRDPNFDFLFERVYCNYLFKLTSTNIFGEKQERILLPWVKNQTLYGQVRRLYYVIFIGSNLKQLSVLIDKDYSDFNLNTSVKTI